eukprot:3655430-Alexandrium_andersonii.AAC.1
MCIRDRENANLLNAGLRHGQQPGLALWGTRNPRRSPQSAPGNGTSIKARDRQARSASLARCRLR